MDKKYLHMAEVMLRTHEKMCGVTPGSMYKEMHIGLLACDLRDEFWLSDQLEQMNSTLRLDLSDDV